MLTHTPVNIAFDETSTRKGHDYMTTFFDLDTKDIIGIYDGNSGDCIKEFIQDHPYPKALKNVSIAMSPAFVSGLNNDCPHAKIVFDKWHVIKLINKHLGSLDGKARDFKTYISLPMKDVCDFYKQKEEDKFAAQLIFVADFAQEVLQDNPITKTILRHFEGISNYAKTKITNAVMEGINAKIQVIKRVARGFRYKENFKKMGRFVFHKPNCNFQVIS